jgi:predicted methyltransferase
MAYHHFPDTSKTTAALMHTLKPNGVLFVVDRMATAQNTEPGLSASKTVIDATVAHKHGFDEATMRQNYEAAGLVDFKFDYATSFTLGGQIMKTFLARGRRPVTLPHL